MRINSIKFSKTVRTEGGDQRLEAMALLDKGENPDAAFEDLKRYVDERLGVKSGSQEFKNTPFQDAFGRRHGESDALTK